jgi:hypothetical protein
MVAIKSQLIALGFLGLVSAVHWSSDINGLNCEVDVDVAKLQEWLASKVDSPDLDPTATNNQARGFTSRRATEGTPTTGMQAVEFDPASGITATGDGCFGDADTIIKSLETLSQRDVPLEQYARSTELVSRMDAGDAFEKLVHYSCLKVWHVVHFIATIVTGGAWIIGWIGFCKIKPSLRASPETNQ